MSFELNIDLKFNQEAQTTKEYYPIIPEPLVDHLRKQFSKRNTCNCGFEGLHSEPIQGYSNHPGGWDITGSGPYWWLFVVCPKCDYAWALWKLGVARERY